MAIPLKYEGRDYSASCVSCGPHFTLVACQCTSDMSFKLEPYEEEVLKPLLNSLNDHGSLAFHFGLLDKKLLMHHRLTLDDLILAGEVRREELATMRVSKS